MRRTVCVYMGLAFLMGMFVSCGKDPVPHPDDQSKVATNVGVDQMLILTTTNEVVAIDFTEIAALENQETALYRWRSIDVFGVEKQGRGEVSAAYFRIGNHEILKNWRYKPWIKCGDLWAEWSYCGPTSVWVYYHPGRSHVTVLSDQSFETHRLSPEDAAPQNSPKPQSDD